MNAKEMGKKGGKVKSEVKANAARQNAKKPRGVWFTAISAEWIDLDGKARKATFSARGQIDTIEKQIKAIEWHIPQTAVSELLECSSACQRFII